MFVRAGGIELPPTAWKAVILPLNYARELKHISINLNFLPIYKKTHNLHTVDGGVMEV